MPTAYRSDASLGAAPSSSSGAMYAGCRDDAASRRPRRDRIESAEVEHLHLPADDQHVARA